MGHDDADLVRRWRQGDPAAFDGLVRRWQGPVVRYLANMVVGHTVLSAELVQDLCQEVFLRVHCARERYRERGSFSTWLFQIAVNVARDALRRGKRWPTLLSDGELIHKETAADDACEQRETSQRVQQAIGELPVEQREVLLLRHYEEMSFAEIGRMTSTPASTLKSRFSAALASLREKLKGLED